MALPLCAAPASSDNGKPVEPPPSRRAARGMLCSSMFHHEPPGYDCPLCAVVAGGNNPLPFAQQSDVVLRTEHTTAFVNARWWPNNAGHVLVVPNAHVENIYDLVAPLSAHLQE